MICEQIADLNQVGEQTAAFGRIGGMELILKFLLLLRLN